MTEHVYLRDKNTGKVGLYPPAFVDLFPYLEEVDPEIATCIECLLPPVYGDAEAAQADVEVAKATATPKDK